MPEALESPTTCIEVILNGERRQVPARMNVAEMLAWLKLPSDRIAVEMNQQLVRKREWEQTYVCASSAIEIVEFVGGG